MAVHADDHRAPPSELRGRAVAAGLVLVLTLAGCAGPPPLSGSGADTVEIVTHTVSEGETLATIADDYYGTPDAAAYLADVNRVWPDRALEAGAIIDVPAGADDLQRYRQRTEAKRHYNRGTELAGRGDLDGAVQAFRGALELDPRFADAGYNLAVVHLRRGEPELAGFILEQVLRVRPGDAASLLALGRAYSETGRSGEALDAFERAARLDPSSEDAVYARAIALLEAGRLADGVVALDAYIRRFPDGAWAGDARARLRAIARARAPSGEGPSAEESP